MSRTRRRRRALARCLVGVLFGLELCARLILAPGVQANTPGNDLRFENGYWVAEDRALVIVGGVRRTVGQPSSALAEHTLYLYGNSVAFGLFVPDADTIASRLQALMREWRVVNLSASGQSVRGQLAWLEMTPVRVGDAVVFLDGSTESWGAYHRARPVAPALIEECDRPSGQRRVVTLEAVLCNLIVPALPFDERVFDAAYADYAQVMTEAHRWTSARGAAFYHFFQPDTRARFPRIAPRLARAPGTLALEVPANVLIDLNGHLSGDGAQIVAQAIYNWLTIY